MQFVLLIMLDERICKNSVHANTMMFNLFFAMFVPFIEMILIILDVIWHFVQVPRRLEKGFVPLRLDANALSTLCVDDLSIKGCTQALLQDLDYI
mmetsp:Transcript_26733/g.32421  ORF Transcript_26733/g.32421 Transcript_26733/m.32421 type:complete len:95 (-) Transcript_26733:11-295(-)